MKSFKDDLKREMKKLKHDVEKISKDQRKEVLRRRKEEMEIDHTERVRTSPPETAGCYESVV